jgi:small subunit ribosomal protein S9
MTETKKEQKEIKIKGYLEAVGRRKTSTARVRLKEGAKTKSVINGSEIKKYFPTQELQRIVEEPLNKIKLGTKLEVEAKVSGGGIHSQAEAVRHGIARAIVEGAKDLRTELKKLGYLKRDPRMKERRKFGLKKARKAPQWSKR